ncbi:YafY family protein [Ruminococcus sp.]|uniref:helix-turn-helix transcriptional regulator n=1 Tax=Ruminococcus sp. TaxID=41978 RepID=UPI0025E2AAB2|nr:YafY family protein [Ruminococcus sp.]MBQ8968033.1 YafY family transcriptional regulator [Ruminococcus sp.]
MKIDRLIGILSILLQKEKVTSAELAEKFEVSRRTILRDIETINLSGIPIVSEQGQGGGISIMEGYKVDRTLLSSQDMQAILSGLRSLDSVSGTNRYRQLMEKISADNSETVNAENHIIVDLSNWDKSAVSGKIELIKQAIEEKRMISFTYYSPSGEGKREIEPYHLIFQWSSWYVWGYCHERDDYRMFKLTRMTDLALSGNLCGDGEVPEYTCDKLRHTKGEIEATVKFSSEIKWRIVDEFGIDFVRYDENGDIIVTFTWSDVPSFYRYILTFGEMAEIISPRGYREGFRELTEKILSKYQT